MDQANALDTDLSSDQSPYSRVFLQSTLISVERNIAHRDSLTGDSWSLACIEVPHLDHSNTFTPFTQCNYTLSYQTPLSSGELATVICVPIASEEVGYMYKLSDKVDI